MFPGYYKAARNDRGCVRRRRLLPDRRRLRETAPDRLVYVDRRNNVLKLAQGEFVTLAKLEAEFGNSR